MEAQERSMGTRQRSATPSVGSRPTDKDNRAAGVETRAEGPGDAGVRRVGSGRGQHQRDAHDGEVRHAVRGATEADAESLMLAALDTHLAALSAEAVALARTPSGFRGIDLTKKRRSGTILTIAATKNGATFPPPASGPKPFRPHVQVVRMGRKVAPPKHA